MSPILSTYDLFKSFTVTNATQKYNNKHIKSVILMK